MEKEKIQPELNIGTIGHIDHGKTSLVKSLTGKWADTHSEELKKGITIRLGYADATFRKCPKCNYYTVDKVCPKCGTKTEYVRKVSFVDAPGHEMLMATMLSGAAIMHGALLVIAANEECPQPQTKEHLMALQILGIKNIVIAQNKIDLVSKEQALKNYQQIKEFVKGTVAENAPIIPVSAHFKINLNELIKALVENIPPVKQTTKDKDPIMLVARSFDINKPGENVFNLKGGVLGGSLIQGKFKLGDKVEILPGYNKTPLRTKIISLNSGGVSLNEVSVGGTIGLGTDLDPYLTKSDNLVGCVVGLEGKLPPVWNELNLKINQMERVVGTKDELDIGEIKINELLMINAWSARTVGVVNKILPNNMYKVSLKLPVCIRKGEKVAVSRMVENRWRLVGYGIIKG